MPRTHNWCFKTKPCSSLSRHFAWLSRCAQQAVANWTCNIANLTNEGFLIQVATEVTRGKELKLRASAVLRLYVSCAHRPSDRVTEYLVLVCGRPQLGPSCRLFEHHDRSRTRFSKRTHRHLYNSKKSILPEVDWQTCRRDETETKIFWYEWFLQILTKNETPCSNPAVAEWENIVENFAAH